MTLKLKKIKPPEGKPFNLELGCGNRKQEGYLGIDIVATPVSDYQFDLTEFPWPIDDEIVDNISCVHFFEHLTGLQRFPFMDECWRILKVGAQMNIISPHWTSMRSIQDPTHQWPPIAETSFLYFNQDWREKNELTHYAVKCDFDFGYGFALDPDVSVRNNEYQHFAAKHYNNAVLDINVTLTKRALEKKE